MDIICLKNAYRVFKDGDYIDIPYDYVNAPKTFTPREYINYLMDVENMTWSEVINYLIEYAPVTL